MADIMFPGKYQSDFAVQVTSRKWRTRSSSLSTSPTTTCMGSGNFMPEYRTSKARVCVTVGMMTTGYDCTDILNLGLFRPIFSPTDFVQIKGRGTRKHNFLEQLSDQDAADSVSEPEKTDFKLFDFFANCEYFETEFNYDQVIKLPKPQSGDRIGEGEEAAREDVGVIRIRASGRDILATIREERVGPRGMKIDRMLFERFGSAAREDETLRQAVESGQWDRAINYVNKEIFDKPEDYYTCHKLRKAAAVDRRISLREILEKVFDLIPRFKSKDELLEEEFAKFVADHKLGQGRDYHPYQALLQGVRHRRLPARHHRQTAVRHAGYQPDLLHRRL